MRWQLHILAAGGAAVVLGSGHEEAALVVAGGWACIASLLSFGVGRERVPRPWRWLQAGLASWPAAWVLSSPAWGWEANHPARLLGNVLFLVGYVLVGVWIAKLVRLRTPTPDAGVRLDGMVVAVAMAAVLGDVLLRPTRALSETVADYVVFLSIPLLMAVAVGATVRLLLSGAHRLPAAWLFVAASLAALIGDTMFALEGGEQSPMMVAAWITAYLLVAAGVAHPSATELTAPVDAPRPPSVVAQLVLVAIALASVATLLLRTGGQAPFGTIPAVAASVVLVFVLWRVARLLIRQEADRGRLLEWARREAALTALSGAAIAGTGPEQFCRDLPSHVTPALGVRCRVMGVEEAGPHAVCRSLGHGFVLSVAPSEGTLDDDAHQFLDAVGNLATGALDRWHTEERLSHQSRHDPLTGIPNRAFLLDRLQDVLSREGSDPADVTVMFLDLDGFKTVNDRLGHSTGDRLLGAVAARLLAAVRPGDTVGRIGGDEFVVVVRADEAVADRLAERLLEVVSAPYELPPHGRLEVGVSIGLARALPTADAVGLLDDADAAMYEAKRAGRGRVARAPATSDPVGSRAHARS